MNKIKKLILSTAAVASIVAAATPASAVTITLNNTGGVEVGTNAFRGFTAAANFWSLVLTNDVNISLNVGFGPLNPGVLGSTGSTTNVALVGQVLPQIASTGNSALDAIAVANLPATRTSSAVNGGLAIDALISGPKANGTGVALPLNSVLDADGSGNNSAFSANTSLLKALGITPTYATSNTTMADGSVTFSSAFTFDFDPSDGIDANAFDFVGIAIHEIGHALGFRSGVDTYDGNVNFTGNLNNFAIMTVWDLFRYSSQSAALGVNDWSIGGNPYFSIDGGETIFNGNAFFSTGRRNGDGQQASHWRDEPPSPVNLGLLDPTAARGQQLEFSSLDLAAYDAMGWNVAYDVLAHGNKSFSTRVIPGLTAATVPEPGTWGMMILGFGFMGMAMRRRARARVTYQAV